MAQEAAPPSGVVNRVDIRVRYGETDQMGVAYHPNYLSWCEIGRTELIRDLGVSYREIEEMGVALAVTEARVRYHAAAKYDDVLTVETTISAVGSRTVSFAYLITRVSGAMRIASAETTLVSIDPSGRVTRLPADIRARLEAGLHTP